MKLTFSESLKIYDERDHPLHFETETETFALWSQNLRLILILLKSVSNFETDTETFGRWSQSLRPALRPLHCGPPGLVFREKTFFTDLGRNRLIFPAKSRLNQWYNWLNEQENNF